MGGTFGIVLIAIIAMTVFLGCFVLVPCEQGGYACLLYRVGMQTSLVLSICMFGALMVAFSGPSTAFCTKCMSVTTQKYIKYNLESYRFSAKCETCGQTNQFERWVTT